MPAVPNQIKIAELDYDQILTNLIEFMKTDPAFADYDFSGSGLRLIARVLAYVTFYQNYYVTAAVNESFLDTAQLRASVASHARMLGYEISGTESARYSANLTFQIDGSSATSLTLPKKTQFVLSSNTSYVFYNLTDVELTQNTSNTAQYTAEGVELVEGRPLTYRFTADLTNPTQRFVIPNANIDYSTIEVRVQSAADSNVVTSFTRASDLLTIDADDAVFFVREAYDGYPEVTFGNGVVGQALEHGNIVIVDYLISRGTEGNSLRGPFTAVSANIDGFVSGASTTPDVDTVSSMGGSDQETLDNARFLAPLVYQAQNRCVTTEDYKTAILAAYGNQVAAINVFGGEQGDPNDAENRPIYGRVFIALKPVVGLRFTDLVRQTIEDTVIKPRSIVGVIPEVIDPDYIYINVTTSVKYDPRSTTRTRPQLAEAISDEILTYAQNNVEKFDTSFRYSRFVRVIDDTDDAIVSSLTRLDLEKRIYPQLDTANQHILKFNSPIRKVGSESMILEATSHRFSHDGDDGETVENCFFYEEDETLHIAHRTSNGTVEIVKSNVGTIDQEAGIITITNFSPSFIENDEIDVRIRVIPSVQDFTPRLNQLYTIDDTTGIAIQLLNDATATTAEQSNFFNGILP